MAKKPAKKSRKRTSPKARKPHAKPSPTFGVTGPHSPEQRSAIVERLRARHTPITIHDTIARPDFHVTTDIRATSDPLWQHLAAFRRQLMEGGTYTPGHWHSLLIDIRTEAHAAGLRPHLWTVEYIVATLTEVRDSDPSGIWDDESDNWSKVILTGCGEAGWIQLHDLLDGFEGTSVPTIVHARKSAIEWAESWMNARERQLADAAVASVSPDLMDLLQRVASATAPPAGAQNDDGDASRRLPKLKPWALEAWRANQAGMTVTGIAEALSVKYKDPSIKQPRVSEQIARAKKHAEASGLAEIAAKTLPQPGSRAPTRTLDPATLDRGKRTDGAAHNLREKARQRAEDRDD